MKFTLLNIVLLLTFSSVFSQKNKTVNFYIDSIDEVYTSTNNVRVKAKMLYNFGWYYYAFLEYDSSILYAKKALDYGIANKQDTVIAKSSVLIGSLFGTHRENDSAIKYLKIGETYLEQQNEVKYISTQIANIQTILAYTFMNKGMYDKAFIYNNKAGSYYRMVNDTTLVAVNLTVRAQLVNELHLHDEALITLQEVSKILRNNTPDINRTISSTYKEIGDINNAKKYIFKSINAVKNIPKHKNDLGTYYQNLSLLYAKEKQYDSAFFYNKLARSLFVELKLPNFIAKADLDKVTMLLDNNLNSKAVGLLSNMNDIPSEFIDEYFLLKGISENNYILIDSAIFYAQEKNNIAIEKQAYFQKYKLYKKKGRYNKALAALETYHKLADSIFNKEKSLAVQKVIVENVIENKNSEIAYKELLYKKEKAEYERFVLIMILISLLMLFVLLFIFYKFRLQKQKTIIVKQEKEILGKENQEIKTELINISLEAEKNIDFLNETKNKLKEIKISPNKEDKINSLFAKTNQFVLSENEKKIYQEKISDIKDDFFDKLNQKIKLTKTEKKLAALLRLNMTSKEIASIINVSESTVEVYRSRLRKKLSIDKNSSLFDYFNSL